MKHLIASISAVALLSVACSSPATNQQSEPVHSAGMHSESESSGPVIREEVPEVFSVLPPDTLGFIATPQVGDVGARLDDEGFAEAYSAMFSEFTHHTIVEFFSEVGNPDQLAEMGVDPTGAAGMAWIQARWLINVLFWKVESAEAFEKFRAESAQRSGSDVTSRTIAGVTVEHHQVSSKHTFIWQSDGWGFQLLCPARDEYCWPVIEDMIRQDPEQSLATQDWYDWPPPDGGIIGGATDLSPAAVDVVNEFNAAIQQLEAQLSDGKIEPRFRANFERQLHELRQRNAAFAELHGWLQTLTRGDIVLRHNSGVSALSFESPPLSKDVQNSFQPTDNLARFVSAQTDSRPQLAFLSVEPSWGIAVLDIFMRADGSDEWRKELDDVLSTAGLTADELLDRLTGQVGVSVWHDGDTPRNRRAWFQQLGFAVFIGLSDGDRIRDAISTFKKSNPVLGLGLLYNSRSNTYTIPLLNWRTLSLGIRSDGLLLTTAPSFIENWDDSPSAPPLSQLASSTSDTTFGLARIDPTFLVEAVAVHELDHYYETSLVDWFAVQADRDRYDEVESLRGTLWSELLAIHRESGKVLGPMVFRLDIDESLSFTYEQQSMVTSLSGQLVVAQSVLDQILAIQQRYLGELRPLLYGP